MSTIEAVGVTPLRRVREVYTVRDSADRTVSTHADPYTAFARANEGVGLEVVAGLRHPPLERDRLKLAYCEGELTVFHGSENGWRCPNCGVVLPWLV